MSKFVVGATWDDVPHLSAEQKAELWGSIPPYQRDARAKGIPQLGSGAIYPVPESEIVADPFELPPHWPRGYGLDVGWNRTAAVWDSGVKPASGCGSRVGEPVARTRGLPGPSAASAAALAAKARPHPRRRAFGTRRDVHPAMVETRRAIPFTAGATRPGAR